jgi:hypothetical protein
MDQMVSDFFPRRRPTLPAGNYSFCSFDPQKLLLIEDVVSYLWNTSLRDMISIMSDFEDKIKREKNTREW